MSLPNLITIKSLKWYITVKKNILSNHTVSYIHSIVTFPVFTKHISQSTIYVAFQYFKCLLFRWKYLIFFLFSDTAATPPESCIFGLMTSVTAMAGRNNHIKGMRLFSTHYIGMYWCNRCFYPQHLPLHYRYTFSQYVWACCTSRVTGTPSIVRVVTALRCSGCLAEFLSQSTVLCVLLLHWDAVAVWRRFSVSLSHFHFPFSGRRVFFFNNPHRGRAWKLSRACWFEPYRKSSKRAENWNWISHLTLKLKAYVSQVHLYRLFYFQIYMT